jgi:hypothetical protein
MTKKELKEMYGIELIGKEMWVWDDDNSEAKLKLVLVKDLSKKNQYALLTWSKDGMLGVCSNASETNPNKTKEPQVGDMGYFWSLDITKGYTYGTLNGINFNHWPFVCDSGVSFTHFSHDKQPWMK